MYIYTYIYVYHGHDGDLSDDDSGVYVCDCLHCTAVMCALPFVFVIVWNSMSMYECGVFVCLFVCWLVGWFMCVCVCDVMCVCVIVLFVVLKRKANLCSIE